MTMHPEGWFAEDASLPSMLSVVHVCASLAEVTQRCTYKQDSYRLCVKLTAHRASSRIQEAAELHSWVRVTLSGAQSQLCTNLAV